MKISGDQKILEISKLKAQVKLAKSEIEAKKDFPSDSVNMRLSQSLQQVTQEIQDSGLTAGQIHSNVEPGRAAALLESFDRLGEGRQPRLPDVEIFEMLDRVEQQMREAGPESLQLHSEISRQRAEELLS